MMALSKSRLSGFTIVELIIVIVIICLLFLIATVTSSTIQARSRDSIRISDMAKLQRAAMIRALDARYYNQYLVGDQDSTDNCLNYAMGLAGGEFSLQAQPGAKSPAECLMQQSGATVKNFIDPSGATTCVAGQPATCFAYFFTQCSGNIYIYAHLELGPPPGSESIASLPCSAGVVANFGMNYFVKASLRGS